MLSAFRSLWYPRGSGSQEALSDTIDEWVARQYDLIKAVLARWAGFGDEHDSWEPYKGLMHVGKLHEYLRANHMKALIPKEHR